MGPGHISPHPGISTQACTYVAWDLQVWAGPQICALALNCGNVSQSGYSCISCVVSWHTEVHVLRGDIPFHDAETPFPHEWALLSYRILCLQNEWVCIGFYFCFSQSWVDWKETPRMCEENTSPQLAPTLSSPFSSSTRSWALSFKLRTFGWSFLLWWWWLLFWISCNFRFSESFILLIQFHCQFKGFLSTSSNVPLFCFFQSYPNGCFVSFLQNSGGSKMGMVVLAFSKAPKMKAPSVCVRPRTERYLNDFQYFDRGVEKLSKQQQQQHNSNVMKKKR